MSRIAENSRDGHASYTIGYMIGYHNCYGCKRETPDPPQTLLDKLAREGLRGRTIWPFDQWAPPGWMRIPDLGELCDDCSRSVTKLLALIGNSAKGLVRETLVVDELEPNALLRANVAKALVLVEGAQLTEFPPPARGTLGRYCHPTGPQVWDRLDDYRFGMMRIRLREIECALKGIVDQTAE